MKSELPRKPPAVVEYRCRACGKQFDSLGDMQRHILVEHHQKGDIVVPSEEKDGEDDKSKIKLIQGKAEAT